jgi:hypothetical protein
LIKEPTSTYQRQVRVKMNQDSVDITNKFSIAAREINRLASKIHVKKGSWLFARHVYTTRELLESKHFDTILAICEKIGDDVLYWCKNEKLSEEGLGTYKREREKVNLRLNSLNKEIQERETTPGENLILYFEGFVAMVLKVLPAIESLIKFGAIYLGLNLSKLIDSSTKNQKLLP